MEFTFSSVNTAFSSLVKGMDDGSIPTREEETRAGKVLHITEPVLITFTNPRNRVLLNPARDPNPFFHVFESIWMLAGRNDVAPLKFFNSKIGDIASDDGLTFNGAYGYRWRHKKRIELVEAVPTIPEEKPMEAELVNIDQLEVLVDHLKRAPSSRRAVLQMWDTFDDLLKVDATKDVCCNTHVYFLLRKLLNDPNFEYALDMTVCNRSNDLVWGLFGANVVHFSFLQEYMAAKLDVEVGWYTHFTNNLHVYTENNSGWHPKEWLGAVGDDYERGSIHPMDRVDLVNQGDAFDKECQDFVDNWMTHAYHEPFLRNVAQPMCRAFMAHKARDYQEAFVRASQIQAKDWRMAVDDWLWKRETNYRFHKE